MRPKNLIRHRTTMSNSGTSNNNNNYNDNNNKKRNLRAVSGKNLTEKKKRKLFRLIFFSSPIGKSVSFILAQRNRHILRRFSEPPGSLDGTEWRSGPRAPVKNDIFIFIFSRQQMSGSLSLSLCCYWCAVVCCGSGREKTQTFRTTIFSYTCSSPHSLASFVAPFLSPLFCVSLSLSFLIFLFPITTAIYDCTLYSGDGLSTIHLMVYLSRPLATTYA